MGTEMQPFGASQGRGGAGCNPALANPILVGRGISGGIGPSLQAANICGAVFLLQKES